MISLTIAYECDKGLRLNTKQDTIVIFEKVLSTFLVLHNLTDQDPLESLMSSHVKNEHRLIH